MFKARYLFGHEGSSHFLRAAADALEESVEPFFETEEWQYDLGYFQAIPALFQRRQLTALAGGDIVLAVIGFISTYFAKKIFDEVYERTLKRPIGLQLDKLFQKVEIPIGKIVEYRDVIYFEDIDLVVVIRAVATKETTAEIQSQIMRAHSFAHRFIEENGRQAPIHCHEILNGQIAYEPKLFRTLEAIKQDDMAKLKVRVRKLGNCQN